MAVTQSDASNNGSRHMNAQAAGGVVPKCVLKDAANTPAPCCKCLPFITPLQRGITA